MDPVLWVQAVVVLAAIVMFCVLASIVAVKP